MSSPKSPLSVSHVAASALAASSAAFAASYLGVAGTIIGAALASVIATVAGAMYGASLQRSSDAVRRTASQLVRSPGLAGAVAPTQSSVQAPTETGLEPVGTDDTQVLLIAPEPPRPARTRVSPARIAVGAAAALAITLGALTGLEGVLGKPISTVLGGSDATGTSLGSAVTGKTGTADRPPTRPTKQDVAPTPAPVVTPTPTPTPPPTEIPTPTPTPTPEPTDPPTTVPTDPPTAEPTPSTP